MTDEATAAPAAPPDDLGVAPGAKVCGNCRLFKPVLQKDAVWEGECRVMQDRGMFPATAPICNAFLAREAPVPKPPPLDDEAVEPRRAPRVGPVVRPARANPVIPELTDMTREELKALMQEVLAEQDTEVRLAPRWEGGKIILKPGSETLQSREIPLDSLFHKVVMVRDRLRVLEQKVNGHPKLTDAEKVDLQQYVTRCYGSLTTFNILFAEKKDQFVGDKTGKDAEKPEPEAKPASEAPKVPEPPKPGTT